MNNVLITVNYDICVLLITIQTLYFVRAILLANHLNNVARSHFKHSPEERDNANKVTFSDFPTRRTGTNEVYHKKMFLSIGQLRRICARTAVIDPLHS